MTTLSKAQVVQEIDDLFKGAFFGLPLSFLPRIEHRYQLIHGGKSPDYKSFGVKNIQQLITKLAKQKKMLLFQKPDREEQYVMSARWARLQQGSLKSVIKDLLNKCGGEIAFSSFEDTFKDRFGVKWIPFYYGLTNLDHKDQLCDVLKDIVSVEVNSSGEKVIKAAVKSYLLRKRKRNK